MRSKRLPLLAALLALASSAVAQAPRKAVASLQLLSGGDYIADHGFVQNDGKVRPLDISPDFLSERFAYSGPARFEIRPVEGPGSKRDDGPPLAWFDLPEGPGPHRLILIVTPRPGSNGISAVNDAAGTLPFGSMRFFNACPYPVELAGEKVRLSLRARSSALLKPEVKDGHYFDLDLLTLDGEPRNVFHLRQFYMTDARTLVFIEPDGPEGQARVKSVEERNVKAPPLKLTPAPEDKKSGPRKRTAGK